MQSNAERSDIGQCGQKDQWHNVAPFRSNRPMKNQIHVVLIENEFKNVSYLNKNVENTLKSLMNVFRAEHLKKKENFKKYEINHILFHYWAKSGRSTAEKKEIHSFTSFHSANFGEKMLEGDGICICLILFH